MAESVIQQKSFAFGVSIMRLAVGLQAKQEYVISQQLLRSATGIGANVEEATAGENRAVFRAKILLALKEARDTHYLLRLLHEAKVVDIDCADAIRDIEEIIRMLTSIVKTLQQHEDSTKEGKRQKDEYDRLKTQHAEPGAQHSERSGDGRTRR